MEELCDARRRAAHRQQRCGEVGCWSEADRTVSPCLLLLRVRLLDVAVELPRRLLRVSVAGSDRFDTTSTMSW